MQMDSLQIGRGFELTYLILRSVHSQAWNVIKAKQALVYFYSTLSYNFVEFCLQVDVSNVVVYKVNWSNMIVFGLGIFMHISLIGVCKDSQSQWNPDNMQIECEVENSCSYGRCCLNWRYTYNSCVQTTHNFYLPVRLF